MQEETVQNGRPTKYDPAFVEQVVKLCRLGATDKELADFFGISEATLYKWKKKHPEFLEAINEGKEKSDAEVADKLYHRALGYSHKEVHVSNYQGKITLTDLEKHYPPDTAACIFWLKNRRRNTGVTWSDKIDAELTGPDGAPLSIPSDPMEIARSVAFILNQAGKS